MCAYYCGADTAYNDGNLTADALHESSVAFAAVPTFASMMLSLIFLLLGWL